MTRQQAITREQVRSRISEANTRANRLIAQAPHATSDGEFDVFLGQISQAISDGVTWTRTLAALELSDSLVSA